MIYSFRSKYQTFHECQRKGYYNYLYGGSGVVRRKKDPFLTTGLAVHEGLAVLPTEGEERAVEVALDYYDRMVTESGLQIEGLVENELIVYKEQRLVIEGLIRVFSWKVWPELQKSYDVVSIERETQRQLTENIRLLGRIDWIIADKKSGDLELVNFKTRGHSFVGDNTIVNRMFEEARYDFQGLNETYLAMGMMKERYIRGVRMIYLSKGVSRWDDKLQRRVQNSPLAYCWTDGKKLAHSFWWLDEKGYERRLGTGWKRVGVWEVLGGKPYKNYLLAVDRGKIQPEAKSFLEDLVVVQDVIERDEEEIREYLKELVSFERQVSWKLKAMEQGKVGLEVFPRNLARCLNDYGKKCPYFGVCRGDEEFNEDDWEPRKPHHAGERVDEQADTDLW